MRNSEAFTARRRGALGQKRRAMFLAFIVFIAAASAFSVTLFLAGRASWAGMNPYLQGMVLSVAAAVICQACATGRTREALRLLIVAFMVSYPAEVAGIHTAFPFGSTYSYDAALFPVLPGGVPLCVPVAWFLLSYTAMVFLTPLGIRRSGRIAPGRLALKASLGGLYIMAADFIIDPLGSGAAVWLWHEPGPYFGVPLANFAGWFLTGFIICSTALLFQEPGARECSVARPAMDGVFAFAAIVLTLVCAAFVVIKTGSCLPLAASVPIMGSLWAFWAGAHRLPVLVRPGGPRV